mgnify:CR=1 FL=1
MKVILLDEIKGKGGEGDVVEVAQGYAENFLFPKKLAVAATKGNLKQLDERRNNIAKREAVRLATANETKAALEGKQVTVDVKVGDKVLTSKYSGTEVKVDGEECTIVRQSDILAVVE